MIESLVTLIRQLHPRPWSALEMYLVVLGVTIVAWVVIDWTVDRAFIWNRRRQIRRILQSRGAYADPSLPLPSPRRAQAVARLSDRAADVPAAVTRGVDRADGTPCGAADVPQFVGSAVTASTLVDPRVAGYATGTTLEVPAKDRVAERAR